VRAFLEVLLVKTPFLFFASPYPPSPFSPATVMLIILGGVSYSTDLSVSWVAGWLFAIVILYLLICLFMPQKFQLAVARFLTFIFALIMGAVTIGIAAEIGSEFAKGKSSPPPSTTTTTTATTTVNGTHVELIEAYGKTMFDAVIAGASGKGGVADTGISISTLYLASIVAMFLAGGLLHMDESIALIHGGWGVCVWVGG
jgi:hypothetical protein